MRKAPEKFFFYTPTMYISNESAQHTHLLEECIAGMELFFRRVGFSAAQSQHTPIPLRPSTWGVPSPRTGFGTGWDPPHNELEMAQILATPTPFVTLRCLMRKPVAIGLLALTLVQGVGDRGPQSRFP